MSNKLGLIITKRCQIKCRHCFESNCSYISTNEDMSLTDAKRYVNEMAWMAKADQQKFDVSISGGEVFLLFDTLIVLTAYAKSAGAEHITCVTNGFWGKNKNDALEKARQLKCLLHDSGRRTIKYNYLSK